MDNRRCDNCMFQYTEVCLEQFGNTICEKYLQRQEPDHQPPRKEGRSKRTSSEKKRGSGNGFTPRPRDTRPVKLLNGQKLYYRCGDEIESGIVFHTSQDSFLFMTKGEKKEYSYSAVGVELFFSRKGVIKNSS